MTKVLNIILVGNQKEYIAWCFLTNVKYFRNKISIEQHNCASKIVNIYIV